MIGLNNTFLCASLSFSSIFLQENCIRPMHSRNSCLVAVTTLVEATHLRKGGSSLVLSAIESRNNSNEAKSSLTKILKFPRVTSSRGQQRPSRPNTSLPYGSSGGRRTASDTGSVFVNLVGLASRCQTLH